MSDLGTIVSSLTSVPTIKVVRKLVRCLPDRVLNPGAPPIYLFTSGKPGRYNPSGIDCVYFGEDEKTARKEYASSLPLKLDKYQPLATYWAEVTLDKVVDLSDAKVLSHLGLKEADLYTTWRGVGMPTITQLLGMAIAGMTGTGHIAAVRYPSAAMHHARKTGFNVVIFRNCVVKPERVRILGPSGIALQEWP